MNEKIMTAMGFGKEVNAKKAGKCPFCGKDMADEKFRDETSKKEAGISGLCQKCQDSVFGGPKKKGKNEED